MSVLRFFAAGIPQPQGSKTRNRFGGVRDANPQTRPWRDTVAWEARHARGKDPTLVGPVTVNMVFTFPHRKSHYRSGRYRHELKASAPVYHTSKPDSDKLVRAVFDALTIAGVIHDDAQVADHRAIKIYPVTADGSTGVTVEVREATTGHLELAGHARLVDELYAERYA
jgi:Holliday junction resolvase RusA-like endonuclease